jgi:hypothetical protein
MSSLILTICDACVPYLCVHTWPCVVFVPVQVYAEQELIAAATQAQGKVLACKEAKAGIEIQISPYVSLAASLNPESSAL